ncbi:glycosyltransferase family 4 protein [Flavivirga sp. 57AJ16]|uniref:glycosyltransferase family 4 protein n=1 Tax=Flavivirga sp. 57AJ16 TaxID=3025307 RepID=UPI00236547FF|nr:glycosyltransferase family 4 protein [Flavivirga sp. 57AJ16]MDD7886240.1 glycosyltransferase family 4 protein [Flavivirga sp. 57AJ16]
MKILWLAPVFNHYKARFLNHLAQEPDIALTILSGTGREGMGDRELKERWSFKLYKVHVPKNKFGVSKQVRQQLKDIFKEFDWVLIPAEKKNLLLFVFALKLRNKNKNVQLFSYNHPVLKSNGNKVTVFDKLLTKWLYKKLDRVVFYTEYSCKWAIQKKLINPKKAFWANNTIDTNAVNKCYSFELPPLKSPTVLFIGRLIQSKKINVLITYYNYLKKHLPNLKLEIIGDGPERSKVLPAIKNDKDIIHHGILIDENEISKIIKRSSLVFIPGHTGLSINHAFAYGRPYVTLKGAHAPEISYLENGINGYELNGNFKENINVLLNLLTDRELLNTFCLNAKTKGEILSTKNWVQQMRFNLLNEY